MFVFVWFFVPETKGLSLEAMDQLFGVTDTSSKGSLNGGVEEETKGGATTTLSEKDERPHARQTEVVA